MSLSSNGTSNGGGSSRNGPVLDEIVDACLAHKNWTGRIMVRENADISPVGCLAELLDPNQCLVSCYCEWFILPAAWMLGPLRRQGPGG